MNIKKVCTYLGILSGMLLLISNNGVAQQLTGDRWSEVKEGEPVNIKIAYYQEDGFAFKNEQGELSGVSIEIFKHFISFLKNAMDVQVNPEFIAYMDFNKMYEDVKNGSNGVFGIGNVTITNERKEEVQFSSPYLTNISVLVTHQDVPDFETMHDIGTNNIVSKAYVYKGTTNEDHIQWVKTRYNNSVAIHRVDSDQEVIRKISSSTEVFSYVDLPVYWLAVEKKRPIKRHPIGDQASESFGFIMPLNSNWDVAMDEFFNRGSGYKSNPAYRNILISYLGPEVTKMLHLARESQTASK